MNWHNSTKFKCLRAYMIIVMFYGKFRCITMLFYQILFSFCVCAMLGHLSSSKAIKFKSSNDKIQYYCFILIRHKVSSLDLFGHRFQLKIMYNKQKNCFLQCWDIMLVLLFYCTRAAVMKRTGIFGLIF